MLVFILLGDRGFERRIATVKCDFAVFEFLLFRQFFTIDVDFFLSRILSYLLGHAGIVFQQLFIRFLHHPYVALGARLLDHLRRFHLTLSYGLLFIQNTHFFLAVAPCDALLRGWRPGRLSFDCY